MKRRKSEIGDKTENKLLVIFKSHDGNAMMMMIESKTCERLFNKYFKAYKFGWSHLKELSKVFQNLINFNSFGSKMAVQ